MAFSVLQFRLPRSCRSSMPHHQTYHRNIPLMYNTHMSTKPTTVAQTARSDAVGASNFPIEAHSPALSVPTNSTTEKKIASPGRSPAPLISGTRAVPFERNHAGVARQMGRLVDTDTTHSRARMWAGRRTDQPALDNSKNRRKEAAPFKSQFFARESALDSVTRARLAPRRSTCPPSARAPSRSRSRLASRLRAALAPAPSPRSRLLRFADLWHASVPWVPACETVGRSGSAAATRPHASPPCARTLLPRTT